MDPAIARQLEGLRVDPEGMIPPGGFYPISPTESEAVTHTRAAVEEYNKLNKGNQNLRFVSIVKGKRQMTGYLIYDVVITATDAAAPAPAQLNHYHLDFWISHHECKIKIESFTHIHHY